MRMLLDICGQTVRTLWAHKLRSFLTMFGIFWGVFSLLLLVGFGEGFRSGNRKELASIGKNIMFIFPGRIPAAPGSGIGLRPYFLTERDYLDIQSEARHVGNVSPVLMRQDIRAVSEFANSNGQVIGVTPNFNQIRHLPLGSGRWMNDLDNEQRRNVAIVGDEMRRNLFPGRPAIGTKILLNGNRFEVIGVISSVGQNENNTTNFRVFIPFQAMKVLFPLKNTQETNAVSFINYQPRIREENEIAHEEVRKIIARNHSFDWSNDEAFEDWDTIKNEQMVGKIFDAMNLFLGGVGLVTLMLGAIGVINIMLVSVSERTKEIGLRKALGATNRLILTQFFLEGAFLTLLSGGIGIAVAGAIMAALGTLPAPEGFDPPKLVPTSAALAVFSLSFAGIVAGLYPASKAAQMEPVEALRKE